MNKRQILTTILSVLLSVFLVAGIVYAVTTISTNIVTEGSLTVTEGITLNEVSLANRGEGTYILVDEHAIGLTTRADVSGVKMEFDYGVTPLTSGDGAMAHGLDVKMIMDQAYDYTTKDYNGTVRGARFQVYSDDDVSGRIVGIYANAQARGASKTIEGHYAGQGVDSPGIVGIHARTELADSATITSPAAAGIIIFHQQKSSAVLTGDYRALQIESGFLWSGASVSGTKTGIHFDTQIGGSATFYDLGIDMSTGVKRFGLISTTETATTTGAYDSSFKLTHTNDAAITSGRLSAMSINLEPKAGTQAHALIGAEICTYLGTADVSGVVTGLFVETQGGDTLGSDYYSLYVFSNPGTNPAGTSAIVRLEEAVTDDNFLDSYIDFVGDNGLYVMRFEPTEHETAWDSAGTPTDAAGWLKVQVGSVDRWIQLYSTAP